MTVEELMAALAKFPPDMRVLVDGYEGGLDVPGELRLARVDVQEWQRSYEGMFEEICSDKSTRPFFQAVVIPR